MPSDSPKKPFSKRHGYRSAKEITIWEDAPRSLRYFVLEQLQSAKFTPSRIRRMICNILNEPIDTNNWSDYNVLDEAERHVYGCEWFRFYDFMESAYQRLGAEPCNDSEDSEGQQRAQAFQDALNEFFVDEGIGWQMVDGEIITRGTETFESNIHSAVEALGTAQRLTAQNEIHEAIGDLSRRPEADLTGAIQHAMAALECVARDVCGDEQATLGEVIKRYPGVIPRPLDESVAKAWGFASEMARHIREGRNPERKEVELIVGLAATVATYLSR